MPAQAHSFSIEDPTDKGYPVYLKDHILSHHIPKQDMEKALKKAKNGLWKYMPQSGAGLGNMLYSFLDGSSGTLAAILTSAKTGANEVKLCLTLPFSLTPLPFELIHNGKQFLLLSNHPKIHLMHTVTERNMYAKAQPSNRSLKILFMACSPLSLADSKVLDFEKEEELIFFATDKYPVDIITEDSGSLSGLEERLYEEGQGGFDILHITGHATADHLS